MTILDKLAELARERVRAAQAEVPEAEMREMAKALGKGGGDRFLDALRKPGLSLICEIKKASPSKGLISPDFPYLAIAADYERGGADCISCLTEPAYFLGSDEIFREVRAAVKLPMLRKDFTVSLYQLDEARGMGADAALLIAALMDEKTLAAHLERCEELGIAALVETHDEAGEQPEPEGLYRGLWQRGAAEGPDPGGPDLCGGKRRADPGGRGSPPADGRRRGADRRGADAGRGPDGPAAGVRGPGRPERIRHGGQADTGEDVRAEAARRY